MHISLWQARPKAAAMCPAASAASGGRDPGLKRPAILEAQAAWLPVIAVVGPKGWWVNGCLAALSRLTYIYIYIYIGKSTQGGEAPIDPPALGSNDRNYRKPSRLCL